MLREKAVIYIMSTLACFVKAADLSNIQIKYFPSQQYAKAKHNSR